jgi:membrane fusion protein (multidrug efflux system)
MEDKSLRKSHRISLPAKVNVGGELYSVLDWSLEGFRAGIDEGVLPEDWNGQVTFILPLQSMNVSFDAVARLRRQGTDDAGFSFDNLPNRSKALLSTYIKASIEGQLDDIEGMIARVEASVTPVRTDKPLTLSESRQFKRSFLGRTLLTLFLILLAAAVVGFIVFNNFSRARSTRAVISGGLIDTAPELPGVLTRVAVKEGATVRAGDLLFALDDGELTRKIEDVKHKLAINKEELEYLYVLLQEESKSVGLYRKAAKHAVERFTSQLQGIEARIAVAQKEFGRAQELIRIGAISQSLWDERRKELLDLESRKGEVSSQLRLAEENVTSAKDGKYLTDGKTRGEMRELEARVRIQEAVLDQVRFQLSEAMAALEKTNVLSRADGVVYAVKRDPGTYLRAGESVMTVFVTDSTPWVLARFTFEEAERFAPGAEASVYIPALNAVCKGTVQAMGHHAMGTGGAVSQDKEISLTEMPVKIALQNPPKGLYPGMGAVVGIETPWLRAFRALL